MASSGPSGLEDVFFGLSSRVNGDGTANRMAGKSKKQLFVGENVHEWENGG